MNKSNDFRGDISKAVKTLQIALAPRPKRITHQLSKLIIILRSSGKLFIQSSSIFLTLRIV